MFVSYNPLWQLLSKNNLKKTDLLQLTGMSSKTLAKLTKNESVTVETLSKICEVLHCNIENVVSITESYEATSLYDAYRNTARLLKETETVTISEVTYQNHLFHIYLTNRKATQYSVIQCAQPDVILWKTMPFNWRLIGLHYAQTATAYKEKIHPKKGIQTIYVINGTPQIIIGLDEGIFRSAKHPGGEDSVHVMSLAQFKTFLPNLSL